MSDKPKSIKSPTLIIGLGGTGKDVLMRVRERFFSEFGQPGLPIVSYVVMDTTKLQQWAGSDDSITTDYAREKLSFTHNEFVHAPIPEAHVREMLTKKQEWPHVARWAHPRLVGQASQHGDAGAGQIRPFGRLAFFRAYPEFLRQVRAAVQRIRSNEARQETIQVVEKHGQSVSESLKVNSNKLDVVVVCSLAGGTGSGMFLDAGFFAKSIGDLLNIDVQLNVTGYLVLPSVYARGAESAGTRPMIEANGYAALKEMEYFFSRDPFENRHRTFERWWERGRKLAPIPGPPFHRLFLLGNENECVAALDNPSSVAGMVAEHVYHSLSGSYLSGLLEQDRSNFDSVVKESHFPNTIRDDASNTTLYHREFCQKYYSFGFGKVFVDIERLRSGAAGMIASSAIELLLQPRHGQRQSIIDRVNSAFSGFLGRDLVLGKLALADNNKPYSGIIRDRLDTARREMQDLDKGRAERLRAAVKELQDDIGGGALALRIRNHTLPSVRAAAVQAAREIVAAECQVSGSAAGGLQAAQVALEELERIAREEAAKYAAQRSAPAQRYQEALGNLEAAERIPSLLRQRAIDEVLSYALADAHQYCERQLLVEVSKTAGKTVLDAVAGALGSTRVEDVVGGRTLTSRLDAARKSLERVKSRFDQRIEYYLPASEPARQQGAVELPFRGGDWPQLRKNVESHVAEELVAGGRGSSVSDAAAHLLKSYFEELTSRRPPSGERTLLDDLAEGAATVERDLWEVAYRYVRDQLDFTAKVNAAATLRKRYDEPKQREHALSEALRYAYPWARNSRLTPEDYKRVGAAYQATCGDAVVKEEFRNLQKTLPATFQRWTDVAGSESEILALTERTGITLLGMEEVNGYAAAYREIRDRTPDAFLLRHIDGAYAGLPEVTTMDEGLAAKYHAALRLALEGIMTGVLRWDTASSAYYAMVKGRDRFSRPKERSIGFSYDDIVERFMNNDVYSSSVQDHVATWKTSAEPAALERLWVLIAFYREETFPSPEQDERQCVGSALPAEHDAVVLVQKDVHSVLLSKGIDIRDASFHDRLDKLEQSIDDFAPMTGDRHGLRGIVVNGGTDSAPHRSQRPASGPGELV